jgi:hypothetical protein
VGCSKEPERLSVDVGDDISVPETPVVKEKFSVNPLTGVKDLEIGKEKDRPVAVTINNISVAQPVQTGLGQADIVYETEVEGGITRLLALFQDVSKVKKLGTIRSARYVFIDLAMGHNAVYAHHGQDAYHAGPHLNDLDRLVIDVDNAGVRISNIFQESIPFMLMAISYGSVLKINLIPKTLLKSLGLILPPRKLI